jgi:hypothetical protein
MDLRAVPIQPARDLEVTRAFFERMGFRTVGWSPDAFGAMPPPPTTLSRCTSVAFLTWMSRRATPSATGAWRTPKRYIAR